MFGSARPGTILDPPVQTVAIGTPLSGERVLQESSVPGQRQSGMNALGTGYQRVPGCPPLEPHSQRPI